ncbi:unnamed protein product [Euphydryas editha]|uniref:Endonuclease/exonuclease/phosphatase domain-containing protein n=1 Tax=Euphydryas editha TaxID=104508 RepID=A0AAU9UX86_EUPED|nr:unnamed protein product [Euphydryas editha]
MATLDLLYDVDNSYKFKCHTISYPEECSNIISSFSLKILSLNIRSLQKNFDNFLVLQKRLGISFDVIVFSECWINEDSTINQLEGYSSFNSNNFINKSGGVVVYVNHRWSPVFTELDIDEANCVLVEVPNSYKVLGVYRSPSFQNTETFITSLDSALNSLSRAPCFVLTGDLNIDIMDTANANAQTSEYLCTLAEHGLISCINTITHYKTCLDHIFVSGHCRAESIVCSTDLSDHDVTMVGISLKKENNVRKRNTKTVIDYDSVRSELNLVDWSFVLSNRDLEDAVETFSAKVLTAVCNNSKMVKRSRSKHILRPWMTPGLLRCARHRDKLHLASRKDPTNEMKRLVYTRYRNFHRTLLRKLKSDYDREELAKNMNKSKKLWGTIKRITHSASPAKSADDLLNIKPTVLESLNECNTYFSNVGSQLAESILSELQPWFFTVTRGSRHGIWQFWDFAAYPRG